MFADQFTVLSETRGHGKWRHETIPIIKSKYKLPLSASAVKANCAFYKKKQVIPPQRETLWGKVLP
jgi:hypothetical protein